MIADTQYSLLFTCSKKTDYDRRKEKLLIVYLF